MVTTMVSTTAARPVWSMACHEACAAAMSAAEVPTGYASIPNGRPKWSTESAQLLLSDLRWLYRAIAGRSIERPAGYCRLPRQRWIQSWSRGTRRVACPVPGWRCTDVGSPMASRSRATISGDMSRTAVSAARPSRMVQSGCATANPRHRASSMGSAICCQPRSSTSCQSSSACGGAAVPGTGAGIRASMPRASVSSADATTSSSSISRYVARYPCGSMGALS